MRRKGGSASHTDCGSGSGHSGPGHTALVIFAIYGRWDHGEPVPSADVATISRSFRPGDESVCVWVEADEPNTLLISIDAKAASYEDALDQGRDALAEAVGTASLRGRPVDVVAMTEEGQVTWSPQGAGSTGADSSRPA